MSDLVYRVRRTIQKKIQRLITLIDEHSNTTLSNVTYNTRWSEEFISTHLTETDASNTEHTTTNTAQARKLPKLLYYRPVALQPIKKT